MQGLGNALFEEMVYQDGALLNPSMLEYRVPSMHDLPDSMTCIIVENADGPGPYGAKGCGEGSLAGTTGAIATAVADAGVTVTELPLTPRACLAFDSHQGRPHGRAERAAIVGTGTMGPGMGAVLARAGIQTALYDVSADALERAKTGVAMADGALERPRRHQGRRGGISYESDLATALAGCQLVIEAAPERLDLKQELFAEFERYVTPDAILASNTSGIPINEDRGRPARTPSASSACTGRTRRT